jgi:hypothetical protein
MGQGLFAAGKFGINVKIRMKIGSQTGKQAFTTWADNKHREYQNRSRRALIQAAAYARTTIRRGMRKSGVARRDPDRAGWNSYTPSMPGAPPRYRRTGAQRNNLRAVRFTRPTIANLRSVVHPIMFRSSGSRRVNFRVMRMLERGGTGLALLPVHPDQNPVWGNTLNGGPWPFAWTPVRYPARPFIRPAVRPTLRQFPLIFARTG